MAEHYSIAEVSRMTGLASHTLRFYEQQFPVLLDLDRTRGGHRIYRARHLEALKSITRLLKDEKMPIRKAREILGEDSTDNTAEKITSEAKESSGDLQKLLVMVIERLDLICRNNEKRDRIMDAVIKNQPPASRDELLDQISRCRRETRETIRLCQIVMQRNTGAELHEH